MVKENIVFIHGSLHGPWCWDNFESFFLENNYTVSTINLQCKDKKLVKINDYVEILNKKIDEIGNNIILVAHSMGSIIALKSLKMNFNKINKMILLSPLPIKYIHISMMMIGLNILIKSKEEIYFSLDKFDKSKEKYIKKFRRDPLIPQLQVLKGIKLEENITSFPILVVTSWNDRCIPAKYCFNTGQKLKAETIVFQNICHDMMLDKNWLLVAKKINEFIIKEE